MCSIVNIKIILISKILQANCTLVMVKVIMNPLMIIKTRFSSKLLFTSQAFELFFILYEGSTAV